MRAIDLRLVANWLLVNFPFLEVLFDAERRFFDAEWRGRRDLLFFDADWRERRFFDTERLLLFDPARRIMARQRVDLLAPLEDAPRRLAMVLSSEMVNPLHALHRPVDGFEMLPVLQECVIFCLRCPNTKLQK